MALNHTLILSLLLVLLLSLLVPLIITIPKSSTPAPRDSKTQTLTASATTEVLGVKIQKDPPHSKLSELGVASWPKWERAPSKFPWTFAATETMYLLKGKVKVSVDGHDGSFEIGAGDLVVFPKGMKVTWDIIEAVDKHYSLED